jgi:hypothetical protein
MEAERPSWDLLPTFSGSTAPALPWAATISTEAFDRARRHNSTTASSSN